MSETSDGAQENGKQQISQHFVSSGVSSPLLVATEDNQKGVAPGAVPKPISASESTWRDGTVPEIPLRTDGGSGTAPENGSSIGRGRVASTSVVGGDDRPVSKLGSEEKEDAGSHATSRGPFSVIPEFAIVPAHEECAFEVAFSPDMVGCCG